MKNTFIPDSATLTQSPSQKEYTKADIYKEKIVSKTSSQKPSNQIENIIIRHSGRDNVNIDYNIDRAHKSEIRRRIKELLSK
jgi:hypothetical protein